MARNNLIHSIAALAMEVDLLDEKKYRDYCIREEFELLYESRKESKKTTDEIERDLSEKYGLSTDSIHKIAYKII